MLPITNHRTVHVPHSLATLAAIAALVTALGWNSVEGGSSTAEAPDPAREMQASLHETATGDEEAGRASAGGSAERAGAGLSGLLPLVLPSVTAP